MKNCNEEVLYNVFMLEMIVICRKKCYFKSVNLKYKRNIEEGAEIWEKKLYKKRNQKYLRALY